MNIPWDRQTRRQRIETVIRDAVTILVYDDRKEDEDLPSGEIEAAIAVGEITVDEMVAVFADRLREAL